MKAAARVLLVSALMSAGATRAQELDIFDPNDFLDPRDRGTVFARGGGLENPGRTFLLVRGYGGYVFDYQWHARPTRNDAGFGHVTASYYAGASQANLKVTYLSAPHESHIPRWRTTAQFARYLEPRVVSYNGRSVRASARVLATASIERSTLHDVRKGREGVEIVSRHLYNAEYGLQFDTYAEPGEASPIRPFVGSFIWIHKPVGEDKFVDRFALFYRFPEIATWRNRIRFEALIGTGAERADDLNWGATRVIGTASVTIPRLESDFVVALGPTYLPGSRDRNFFGEIAVYLGRTFGARLGDLPENPRALARR